MSMVAFEDDGFVTEVIHAKWARVPADPAGSAARGRPSPAGTRRQHPRGSSGTGGKSSNGSRPVSDPLTRGHEEGTGGGWRARDTGPLGVDYLGDETVILERNHGGPPGRSRRQGGTACLRGHHALVMPAFS